MSFVADLVEDVGDAVGDVFEAVGDVVEDVGDVVGDALEYVGDTIEAVIEDPLPTLISIAGAAVGIPPAITSAAITAAKGGDLEDIVLSAGTSYVAGQAGQFVSSSIAPAISETIASVGFDDATLNKAITDAATRSITGGITSELRGGDFEQGALSGITGSLITSGVKEFGGDLDPTTQKIISSGLTAAALGQDPSAALANSLISSGLSAVRDSSWGVNPQPSQDIGDIVGSETPFDLDDAEIGVGVDLTGGTGMPIQTEPIPSPYEGLEGYTPEVIQQLYDGTYAGPEAPASDTEALLRNILGDETVNQLYPEGLPTSSSAYEGLGYDANLINQLMQGTYSGPEQTEAEVRQQMGDELFNLAYPQGYNAAMSGTTGTTSGGTGTTSGGTAAGTTGTTAAGGTNYGALGQKIQNIFNTQEPNYPSPIKPYLSPNMLVGQIDRYAQQAPDYAQIIPKLAGILGQRGYKTGGSVSDDSEYVAGPEGKLYEKHYERGFAVGGPGTGQSDDIPTMLSDGEYVFDADTVAALGDGSSKAGAEILDKFRQEIRSHKRSAPTDRIPPKAKNPLAYLKSATKSKG